VLRKRLARRPYKFQLLQTLQPGNRQLRLDFCVTMVNRLEEDNSLFLATRQAESIVIT
jgi:hypothetical protein